MNEKIKQCQLRFFNNLFFTLPTVKKMNEDKTILNLDKPISHYYYFNGKRVWFCKGETEDKYIYLFGKYSKEKDIGENDATLIIDFDKNEQFNDDNLGLFITKGSEIHIFINDKILNHRYPNFNTGDFKINQYKLPDKNKNINVIDLGSLGDDFIINIEKFIELTPNINKKAHEKIIKEEILKNEDKKDNKDLCEICSKNKRNVKIDSKLNTLSNIRPELCGDCIEKIVASEFYQKVNPLITDNETKSLKNVREKFSNDQLFDLGMKLLEKYKIFRYMGNKRLFFRLEKNSQIVSEFIKYSDKNNFLIDNIFKINKNKTNTKTNKKIDINRTNLTKKTIKKMNLFINSLESGKTHEQAYNIAKINKNKVESWYKFGENGDMNYIPFYEKYKPFRPENLEKQKKMELFLDTLKEDGNIDNALKKSNLKISKVRAWYSLGEKGNEEYHDFYLACNILLPNGIPKKETKKIVNNDELMNEFIALIDDGKTNNEAIKQLKIPKFKVKNWVNQGKLGNKKYIDFYNAYMIEIEAKKELKKAKKQEKRLQKQKLEEEKLKQIAEEIYGETTTISEDKSCKICGRTLNKKTKKDICKRCLRKQYASKIVLKLLKSIEPEKPFKKEDLKVLGLQNIQITDYLWTLQEFDLINKNNNKLQLINKNELETFIKESGLDIDELPQGQSSVKLNKTCKTCGKSLEISKFFSSETTEDGFEDNCKYCKRLITAANYLTEIIEFVDYESEFTENELKPHFKNSFQLQAKIWALLDNDLIKKNFENNTYTLTDEKTANEFLDKYYEENESKPNNLEEIITEPTSPTPSREYTKNEQMSIIINAIKEGKSRKDAAEIANIPFYKITHWYNEGKQGFGKENSNFYKQLKYLEGNNESKKQNLKKKMDNVLDELKTKKDITKVTQSSEFEINEWIKKGKNGEEPYNYFFEIYNTIPFSNEDNNKQEYENKEINRKIFFENFKNGKTKEQSAEYSNLDLSLVHEWYLKGQNNEEPYRDFYNKYIEIKNNKPKDIPRITKKEKYSNYKTVSQMNIILESLAKGMSEKEAVKKSGISFNTYKYWLNRGKQEFGAQYTQFYHYVVELKQNNDTSTDINDNIDELLVPLDEEYEMHFRPLKMNRTGIAWVNIIGKKWIYQKTHEKKPIKISNSNIYKLYQEVKDNNLPWGIRDLNIAKSLIQKHYDLTDKNAETPAKVSKNAENKADSGIYAPLPEKYEQSFKSSPMNKSGIAWVNNPSTGKKWIYEKRDNGEIIRFVDEDIYELYNKVKKANHIWGIRDYSKAKKIIDIPDDFEIPQKQINMDKSKIIPEFIDPDIYAPLPEELTSTFNPTQANKTGIAWVNKSGSKWKYSRKINGKTIEVIDENIYELHKKVKDLNYDWGIKDYQKAKEIIIIPENYQPAQRFEEPYINEKYDEISTDIYAPLPKKYLNSFNPKQPNKTGIAWVNLTGSKWTYQRRIDGLPVKFSDSDIRKLHEVVIKNGHIWGIIDFDKAKKVIERNPIPSENIKKHPITSGNVTVTYIEKSLNEFDIIIKGIIKNTELINLLNRLELFEENIKRIITTAISNQVDIFIELELKKYSLRIFENKIDDLNWKIIK